MEVDLAARLGKLLEAGGVYFALGLTLVVIGFLFAKNQALHAQLLSTLQTAHLALKSQQDRELATAKELAPLASDMVRVIQRLIEIEALYGKKTVRRVSPVPGSAAGGGSVDPRGSG